MTIDNQAYLLDHLHGLLEKQIDMARHGNIGKVEMLGAQAGLYVKKIANAGLLQVPEFKSQREKLQKAYEHLHLILSAQKAEVCEQLNRVRKGKNTMKTYRNNI